MTRRWLLWVGLILALGVPSLLIGQKEMLLARGTPILLELAPVDPRSLMQGDYMSLRYALASRVSGSGRMVIQLDARGVAQFVRPYEGGPLAAGEMLLRYRGSPQGEPRLGAESYFFQEGQAEHFAAARYGELRVTPAGDSVLVGLRDADLGKL